MGAFGLLLTLVLTCFWGSVRGNYFFVVAPNMIRFEHPETVLVSVFGNQKTVSVWFSHGDRRFSEHNNLIVSEDTPHQVEMVVKETDLALEDGETKPRTIVLNALCDGDHKQKEILLQYSSGYIFVQTSQPIYVPRSNVKIRYLAVDESMKKLGNEVNVSMDIISPDNQVFSRRHKTNSEAFYTYDFELPPNPEMGIWTIKVYFKGMYETEEKAFFEVREYVVPTFGVDIDATPYTILENTPGTVIVTVTSKYVYGKPVIGTADIKLILTESTGDTELLAMPGLPLNADGQAEFRIPVGSLRRPLEAINKWFPDTQRLKVVATVTEGATLKKEAGIHEGVVFSRVQYKFKFDRSKKYFRPLRKYYLKLDATFPNGHVAARVDVIATQRIAGRTVERDGETDDNGQITFIFDCEGDTMTFSANDANGMSPSDEFVVEAYSGANQILAEHVIKDGEHQIRSFNNIQENTATGLTSLIVARGKILDATSERQSNEAVKILTDDLQEQISPSGRYIIFYCDMRTHEVVADAIKFTLTPRCKGQGIHLNSEQRVTPGDSKDMRVTGQPGTHVGLSVVDKAVLLLNNKNVLHKNKAEITSRDKNKITVDENSRLYDGVEVETRKSQLFQELDSHDLGCGYGGGRNSAHVFGNAGLTVITNAQMADTGVRESKSCEQRGRRKRSTECEADQRCCAGGEEYAISLYEDTTIPKVEAIECYSEIRKLVLVGKKTPDKALSFKCLDAFFRSCAEYIQFRNEEDAPGTKSGDSDYLMDLREIMYNEKKIYVRKNFKEAFQFDHYTLGANTGEITVKLKYPDSITEWMVQAIGVTPNNGVCISEPLNVTAFREFFIQLDLPYQAVRMEHIDVKATVFFYGDGGSNSAVSIYMDGQEDLCSNTRPGQKSKKVEFEMSPNSAHEVRFPVIPMVAPRNYPIKITAIMTKRGVGQVDAIEKKLYVINEGKEKLMELRACLDPMKQLEDCQRSERMHVTYQSGDEPRQIITIDLTMPPHIQGTGQGVAYVYSDNAMEDVVQSVLLGGVERFINLPGGCVEQTIIGLAPLVYAMNYLKLIKQITEDIERNGNSHVRAGVLWEFRYKKSDHSYPPYARSGSSTWLTAFISKVFCQAKKAVDDSVDEGVHITPTINWLTNNQNGDGSFTEVNYVNHGPLMGLSEFGTPALTAFILAALQECKTRNTNVERTVQRAMQFLEGQDMNTLRGDPYALSVITYALALSNSTRKMTFYENLKNIAGRSSGMMYWGWSGTGAVQASHIEATSYALLAMLQLDDLRASNETVKWLSLHRSSGGAFQTTQDTVIGLQALSEYNIRTYQADVDLTVKFMADNYPEKIFKLNKDSALVQKSARNLPVEDGNDLRVEVTGKGTGNIRVDLRYNVDKSELETCPFDIDITSMPIDLDETAINIGKEMGCECGVCDEEDEEAGAGAIGIVFGEEEEDEIGTNFGRKKRSAEKPKLFCVTMEVMSKINTVGMVTIEVGLETGMTVNEKDLEKLIVDEVISMYELPTNGNGFFVLYVDKMFESETYRYVFTLKDDAGDGLYNRQAASVKVVDYYNPGARCQSFYGTGSNLEPSYSANCNDGACQCLINTCPEPWKDKLKKKQQPAIFLIQRTCNRHHAEYAVRVKVNSLGDGDVGQKESSATTEVIAVYNQGAARQVVGSTMKLFWRMDCEWPKLEVGKKYYIIARDGKPYKDGDEKKYKYYIREGDIVLEWKPPRTPVGRFMKGYENYWKTRQCPK